MSATSSNSSPNPDVPVEPVHWLNEDEARAWTSLLEVNAGLMTLLEQDLKKATGITLEDYEVFHVLSQEPDHQLRIGTLTERLLARRTRLSQRIDRLVDKGLLGRSKCPEDGRAINVFLTDDGFEFLTRIAPIHLASARKRVFNHWDDDDVRNVGHSLGKVVAYLRSELS